MRKKKAQEDETKLPRHNIPTESNFGLWQSSPCYCRTFMHQATLVGKARKHYGVAVERLQGRRCGTINYMRPYERRFPSCICVSSLCGVIRETERVLRCMFFLVLQTRTRTSSRVKLSELRMILDRWK